MENKWTRKIRTFQVFLHLQKRERLDKGREKLIEAEGGRESWREREKEKEIKRKGEWEIKN